MVIMFLRTFNSHPMDPDSCLFVHAVTGHTWSEFRDSPILLQAKYRLIILPTYYVLLTTYFNSWKPLEFLYAPSQTEELLCPIQWFVVTYFQQKHLLPDHFTSSYCATRSSLFVDYRMFVNDCYSKSYPLTAATVAASARGDPYGTSALA